MDYAANFPVHSCVVDALSFPPQTLDELYLLAASHEHSRGDVDEALHELCDLDVVSLHPDVTMFGMGSSTPFVVTTDGRTSYRELLLLATFARAVGCAQLIRMTLDWRRSISQRMLWKHLDFATRPKRYGQLHKLLALWQLKQTGRVRVSNVYDEDRLVQLIAA